MLLRLGSGGRKKKQVKKTKIAVKPVEPPQYCQLVGIRAELMLMGKWKLWRACIGAVNHMPFVVILNSKSPCLSFLSSGAPGMYHHTWLASDTYIKKIHLILSSI